MEEIENKISFSEEKLSQFIYDDIDDAEIFATTDSPNTDDITDLQLNTELVEENKLLKESLEKSQKTNELLQLRISQLYMTAKAEIERKDERINEMKTEKDNMIFRRKNYLQNRNTDQKDFSNEGCPRFNSQNKFPKNTHIGYASNVTKNPDPADITDNIVKDQQLQKELTNEGSHSFNAQSKNLRKISISENSNVPLRHSEPENPSSHMKKEPKIEFSNEGFQRFNSQYKIPKKVNARDDGNVITKNSDTENSDGHTKKDLDLDKSKFQENNDESRVILHNNYSKDHSTQSRKDADIYRSNCKRSNEETKVSSHSSYGKDKAHADIAHKKEYSRDNYDKYKHNSEHLHNEDKGYTGLESRRYDRRHHTTQNRSHSVDRIKSRDRERDHDKEAKQQPKYQSRSRSKSTERGRRRSVHKHIDERRSRSRDRNDRNYSRYDNSSYRHRNARRSRSVSRERYRPDRRENRHYRADSYNRNNFKDRTQPGKYRTNSRIREVHCLREKLLRYRYESIEKDAKCFMNNKSNRDDNVKVQPDNIKLNKTSNFKETDVLFSDNDNVKVQPDNTKYNKTSNFKDNDVLFSEEEEIKLFLSGESDIDDNKYSEDDNFSGHKDMVIEGVFELLKDQNIDVHDMTDGDLEQYLEARRKYLKEQLNNCRSDSEKGSECESDLEDLEISHSYLEDADQHDDKSNKDENTVHKTSVIDQSTEIISEAYKKRKRDGNDSNINNNNDTLNDEKQNHDENIEMNLKKFKEIDVHCKKTSKESVDTDINKKTEKKILDTNESQIKYLQENCNTKSKNIGIIEDKYDICVENNDINKKTEKKILDTNESQIKYLQENCNTKSKNIGIIEDKYDICVENNDKTTKDENIIDKACITSRISAKEKIHTSNQSAAMISEAYKRRKRVGDDLNKNNSNDTLKENDSENIKTNPRKFKEHVDIDINKKTKINFLDANKTQIDELQENCNSDGKNIDIIEDDHNVTKNNTKNNDKSHKDENIIDKTSTIPTRENRHTSNWSSAMISDQYRKRKRTQNDSNKNDGNNTQRENDPENIEMNPKKCKENYVHGKGTSRENVDTGSDKKSDVNILNVNKRHIKDVQTICNNKEKNSDYIEDQHINLENKNEDYTREGTDTENKNTNVKIEETTKAKSQCLVEQYITTRRIVSSRTKRNQIVKNVSNKTAENENKNVVNKNTFTKTSKTNINVIASSETVLTKSTINNMEQENKIKSNIKEYTLDINKKDKDSQTNTTKCDLVNDKNKTDKQDITDAGPNIIIKEIIFDENTGESGNGKKKINMDRDNSKNSPKAGKKKNSKNEQLKENEKTKNKTSGHLEIEAAKTLCSLGQPLDFSEQKPVTSIENLKSECNSPVKNQSITNKAATPLKKSDYSKLIQELYITDSDEEEEVCERAEIEIEKTPQQKLIILSDVSLKLSDEDIKNLSVPKESDDQPTLMVPHNSSECIEQIREEINNRVVKDKPHNIIKKEDIQLNTTELQKCLEEDSGVDEKIKIKSPSSLKRRGSGRKSSPKKTNLIHQTTENVKEKITETAKQIKRLFGLQDPSPTESIPEQPKSKSNVSVGKSKKCSFADDLLQADVHVNTTSKNKGKKANLTDNNKTKRQIKKPNTKPKIEKEGDQEKTEEQQAPTSDNRKENLTGFCNSLTYIPIKKSEVPFDSPNSFIAKKVQARKQSIETEETKPTKTEEKIEAMLPVKSKNKRKSPAKKPTRRKQPNRTTKKSKNAEEESTQNKPHSWKIRLADNSRKKNRNDISDDLKKKKRKSVEDESDEEDENTNFTTEKKKMNNVDSNTEIDIKHEDTTQQKVTERQCIGSNAETKNITTNKTENLKVDITTSKVGRVLKRITPKRVGECTRKKKNESVKMQLFSDNKNLSVEQVLHTDFSSNVTYCTETSIVTEESIVIESNVSKESMEQKNQTAPNSSPLPSFERYFEQTKNLQKQTFAEKSAKSERSKSMGQLHTADDGEFPDIHIDPLTLLGNKEIDNIIIDLSISDRSMLSLANCNKSKSDKGSNDELVVVTEKNSKSQGNSLDFLNFLSKNASTPIKNRVSSLVKNETDCVFSKTDDGLKHETKNKYDVSTVSTICSNQSATKQTDVQVLSPLLNTSSDNGGIKTSVRIGVPLKRDRTRRAIVRIVD